MNYVILKDRDSWLITYAENGGIHSRHKTRKAAVLTAQLLAGWRGSVRIQK